MLQTETHSVVAKGFSFFEAATFLPKTQLAESYINTWQCIIEGLPSVLVIFSSFAFTLSFSLQCRKHAEEMKKRFGSRTALAQQCRNENISCGGSLKNCQLSLYTVLYCYLFKKTTTTTTTSMDGWTKSRQ